MGLRCGRRGVGRSFTKETIRNLIQRTQFAPYLSDTRKQLVTFIDQLATQLAKPDSAQTAAALLAVIDTALDATQTIEQSKWLGKKNTIHTQ